MIEPLAAANAQLSGQLSGLGLVARSTTRRMPPGSSCGAMWGSRDENHQSSARDMGSGRDLPRQNSVRGMSRQNSARGLGLRRAPSGKLSSNAHQTLLRTASWSGEKHRKAARLAMKNKDDPTKHSFAGRTKLKWDSGERSGDSFRDGQDETGASGSRRYGPRAMVKAVKSSFRAWRDRGYIFDHTSRSVAVWEWTLCVAVVYNAAYLPFALVFRRWPGDFWLATFIDLLFVIDILVRRSPLPTASFRAWHPSQASRAHPPPPAPRRIDEDAHVVPRARLRHQRSRHRAPPLPPWLVRHRSGVGAAVSA